MTWKTHLIGGAQAGLIGSYVTDGSLTESAVIFSASILGSLLPDIDKRGSKIAKSDSLIGLISFTISKFTKHRGFLHTVFGAAVFAAIFYVLAVFRSENESLQSFFMAFTVFVLVHAIGGVFSRLAGWLAAWTYIMGPEAVDLLSGSNIELHANVRTASICSFGVFLGCMMHMIYDSFNSGGIKWAYPLSEKNFSLLSIKTNSAGEVGFFAAQVFVLAAVISVCYRDSSVLESVGNFFDELKAIADVRR